MASKTPKNRDTAGNLCKAITVASAVLTLITPVVDKIDDKLKDLVTIPELCSKTNPMKLDLAIDALEKLNLKVGYSAVQFKNADIKYRNCSDLQVVWSDHRRKRHVKPGSLVLLKYVTSEIIEESQRLFDELEKQKAELKRIKDSQRIEQKQKSSKAIQ